MEPVTLYRIVPALNMQRFYCMHIQTDLFGKWSLVREYGRIGRSGKTLAIPYETEDEAEMALSKLSAMKHKKGYDPQKNISNACSIP